MGEREPSQHESSQREPSQREPSQQGPRQQGPGEREADARTAGEEGTPRAADLRGLAVGDVVARRAATLTRDSLVRYAGASGDFNPIHYRDDIAAEVGLPGVLAHGMLTMGLAIQPLVDALGDPGRVVAYRTKFTKPVVVDAAEGAEVAVTATIGALAGEDGIGRVDLEVVAGGEKVLGRAQARVLFAAGASARPGAGSAT